MENDELLKNIMEINISMARMEQMIAGEFALIQKEQTSVMGKIDDMEKELKLIQSDYRKELKESNIAIAEKIKTIESKVAKNDTFRTRVYIAFGLIIGGTMLWSKILAFFKGIIN